MNFGLLQEGVVTIIINVLLKEKKGNFRFYIYI